MAIPKQAFEDTRGYSDSKKGDDRVICSKGKYDIEAGLTKGNLALTKTTYDLNDRSGDISGELPNQTKSTSWTKEDERVIKSKGAYDIKSSLEEEEYPDDFVNIYLIYINDGIGR